jgi:hypothetical protein
MEEILDRKIFKIFFKQLKWMFEISKFRGGSPYIFYGLREGAGAIVIKWIINFVFKRINNDFILSFIIKF